MPEPGERRALYLRWRPQSFAEVVGQDHVTRTLRNAVRGGKLAHAYLLCGPRGTGKTSLARILYRAANCENAPDGEPCGACATCVAAASGRSMDLVEIDAASNRGIEDIRQLRERVAYAPSEGRFRVYIIDEAHELTGAAWDAFLKTLEEPPRHTIFVLATTEAHKVPPTIVSRCQRFDLRRISLGDIRSQLSRVAQDEAIDIEAPALDSLARMARGGMRDALSLLDQVHAYAGQRVDLEALRTMLGVVSVEALRAFLTALETKSAPQGLEQLSEVVEQGADLRQFVAEVVAYLRGLLLTRCGAAAALGSEFSPDDIAWFGERAPLWTPERLLSVTTALADGAARLRDPVQLELHLELAILAACQDAAAPGVEQPVVSETTRIESRSAVIPTQKSVSAAPPRSDAASTASTPPIGEHLVENNGVQQEQPGAVAEPAGSAEEPTGGAQHSGDLTLESVQHVWPALMDHLRVNNGVVAAMLETAHPVNVDEREVRVAFGFAFHQRRMSDLKNRRVVEDVLRELLGCQRRVTCVLQSAPAPAIRSQEQLTTELDRLIAEDPVVRRAADLWGRNLTIVE